MKFKRNFHPRDLRAVLPDNLKPLLYELQACYEIIENAVDMAEFYSGQGHVDVDGKPQNHEWRADCPLCMDQKASNSDTKGGRAKEFLRLIAVVNEGKYASKIL